MDALGEQAPAEVEDGSLTLKLLIPGTAAGSVIGKGGATINELQTNTGARIQLSRNAEVFPGTSDRLVTLSGNLSQILGALHLMINKLVADGESLVASKAMPPFHTAP